MKFIDGLIQKIARKVTLVDTNIGNKYAELFFEEGRLAGVLKIVVLYVTALIISLALGQLH